MIDAATAITIADEHIAKQAAAEVGYRFARSEPSEVEAGWYFAYCIECDLDIPEAEQLMFGGAPGFVVGRDDGDIEISFPN